jgi:thiamine biosynthesis lipoprotein
MSTSVEITLCGPEKTALEKAMDAAFSEIARIEKLLSVHREDSTVFEINRNGGQRWMSVGPEVFYVLEKSLYYSRLSGGCFDITVQPLLGDLWNFRVKDFHVPTQEEVKSHLELVNYRKIRLNKKDFSVLLEKKGMKITLGGIAKGYAVDRAVEIIRKSGIADGIVKAGGDLKAFGRKENGGLWTVGIKNPRDTQRLISLIPLSNLAVSTSGDYERFQIVDGVRYHHIMDPRTGYPARGCMSTTVITKRSVDADALSTSVFVLGPEEGMKLLEWLPDTEGIIVNAQGGVTATSGLGVDQAVDIPETAAPK